MRSYRFMQQKYLVGTYPDRGLTFVEGEGVYLIADSGEKYLDLMTNFGVNIFGYNNPFLVRKIQEQLGRLTTLHASFNNDMRARAAMKLVQYCGGELAQVYLSNSGAEAVEAALKFAVLATGRKKFVACMGGYHGKTLGALSAAGAGKYRHPFEPLLWEFRHIAYNDLGQLEKSLDEETAAFLVEPVQGDGGVRFPDADFLEQAKDLCRNKGILLIADEVQAGTGRLGRFLACHEFKTTPDIVCLGKGLAGGVPVGATLVSEQVAKKITKSIHTSTFGGNPLAAAGILATLELIDEQRLSHIRSTGTYFREGIQSINSDMILQVRGKGLLLGIEVREHRDDILKKLQSHRILAVPAAARVIRFLPPYIMEKAHVDRTLKALKEVFAELQGEAVSGTSLSETGWRV